MCRQVTVHEAKTHLSRLLVEVEAGASIVITRSGKPVAKLVAFEAVERRPGRLKGKIRMARDFEAPLPEALARLFRGEGE
ncbi:MAG: type II toxin-antitoxin system prevent-host-death family antitoxin [Thermoanaerobaculia bacterium]